MSFREKIWEEIGNTEVEFTNLDESTETVTANEMRERVIELSEKHEYKNFDDRLIDYEFRQFIGKIKELMNQKVEKHFPPYKDCAFRIDYNVENGEESYYLNCIRDNYIGGINSKRLDKEYNRFKEKIDDGSIYW